MIALLLLLADAYYVSPGGDDAKDGRSPATAWKTVAKVNATAFSPGDQILFARGGEWREALKAGSSGAPDKPIVYAAYGSGPKPKFWGSDVVKNGDSIAAPVAAVLVDHVFLPADAWSCVKNILALRDPPKGVVTACVRVDLLNSNGKDHLVFRDLVADESADARHGYGVRVMGSDDVRLEDCEAYRAGRHHFGAINSTNVVGLRLKCAVALPAIPGGATFYVSFSDASRKGDTHQWIDCVAERLENPGERPYQCFYDHGEGLGPILIRNMTSRGGRMSVDSTETRPVTVKGGLIEDATLELFGSKAHVDGLSIRGNGGVDSFGSNSLFENLLVAVEPKNGGPTGYGAGILFREGANWNRVRFSTVSVADGAAVKILGARLMTRLSGSILITNKQAVEGHAELELNVTDDPLLGPDFVPKAGSPVIGAGKIEHPETDHAGRKRPSPCALGAFEPK